MRTSVGRRPSKQKPWTARRPSEHDLNSNSGLGSEIWILGIYDLKEAEI